MEGAATDVKPLLAGTTAQARRTCVPCIVSMADRLRSHAVLGPARPSTDKTAKTGLAGRQLVLELRSVVKLLLVTVASWGAWQN
jgi:hypothetical protein